MSTLFSLIFLQKYMTNSTWNLNFFGKTNLLAVTLYEIGLDVDDVQAIQALYGAPGLPRPQDDEMREVDIETGNLM